MTRVQQTIWIIAAMVILAAGLAWVMWPAPDFANMESGKRCDYSAWYENHGGTAARCHHDDIRAAARRLGGYY